MSKYFYTDEQIVPVFRSQDLQYPSQYSLDELIKRVTELNDVEGTTVQENQSIAVVGNSGKLRMRSTEN